MFDRLKIGRGVLTAAAMALVISPLVASQAPPPAGGQRGQAPEAPAPGAAAAQAAPTKPLLPLSVSTLVSGGDKYVGENVTVTGPVEKVLSTLSFSLDTDPAKSSGKEVLVIAPRLNAAIVPNSYITVLGKVIKYDPATIAQVAADRKIDVPADAASKFTGKPVLLATEIMTDKFVDLTRRDAPPMTADDQMVQAIMKKVQPAAGQIRGLADKSDMAGIRQNTATLRQSFTEVEAFFKQRNRPDAVKLAQDARAAVDNIDKVVGTGKWDDVKTAAQELQQKCAACHNANRERFDDGSFRIKVMAANTK
jgi:hypothetical protein